MGTGEFNAGGSPAMDWHPIQGGVEIFLVASCHRNRDKLRPDGPLGSYADFTFIISADLRQGLRGPRKTLLFVQNNGKLDALGRGERFVTVA